ncbi:hypothetical protein FE257_003648 [Aspergillus nanangensis]|uniref:NmrA-like domain-containing protein n=1 Tax=Aspergillus nanangensis TaxID=2582783 RepID=A0AAD4CSG9_ASPNN|nr:hypothetical protein FE257_003648 [Aspergillus nanangensis]
MSVVAVAGGTGGVGKTIVETLLEQATFQVIVLTRTIVDADPVLDKTNQIQVNYNDLDFLVRVLEEQRIQTIISAIGIYDDATSQSQMNLIQAAEYSKQTQRFIPSEYSFIQTEELLSTDPSIQYFLDAADMLHKSSLKYTRVIPGFFMDYWGMPSVRTNLQPLTFGIDLVSCQAAIPGDGNDLIGMTYSYDMAKFIVQLLALEAWPEFSIFVGDDITYNQLLALAEQVRGKKFSVSYDSVEDVLDGKVTVPPMPPSVPYSEEEVREMTALVSRLTVRGAFNLPVQERLNCKFPDVHPVNIKDFLQGAWKSQQ